MAPEQFSTPQSVDHRADIYASGVVLHEMLTGKLPRKDRARTGHESHVDQRFQPIVNRATEQDRERRYQKMQLMNADLTMVTRTPDTTIRLEQLVPAPIEKVFAAWTNPEQMSRWYAPSDEYTTPVAEADAKVGGAYRVGMQHKDHPYLNLVCGQYCRIEPPHVLQFTWAWETPTPSPHETQMTLEFRPAGSGATNLTLIHERFRDEESRKQHTHGWTGCLARLAQKINA